MVDLGTTHPSEMDEGNVWEATQDQINNGEGVSMVELIRRARAIREIKASPEMRELMERVRMLSEVPPEVQQDAWRHTAGE